MATNNFEKFRQLIGHMRSLSVIVGLLVLEPNFKINVMTCVTGFVPTTVGLSFIYMIFNNVTLSLVLEGTIMMSLFLQGITKFILLVRYPHKYYNLCQKVNDLYLSDIKVGKNTKVLSSCIQICTLMYKIFCVAYSSVFVIYICFPIIAYIYYEMKITQFPVHIPFIELKSTFGFTINVLHQTAFLAVGVFGILFYDVFFLIIVVHSIAKVNTFQISLDDVDDAIRANQNHTEQLKAAIQNHQSLIEYFQDINDTYSIMAMVQIISSGTTISVAVFLWLWDSWIVSPILIIVGTVQLFEFCVLGTITQIENEATTIKIYEMLWFLMPANDQQIALLMLLRSQRSNDLDAGSFAKLNVATGLQVMKMIYSFAMMIKEVIV